MRKQFGIAFVVAAGALASMVGLGSCGGGAGGFFISNEKEVQIGEGVDAEIEKEYKIVADDDPLAIWARQLVAPLEAGSTEFRDPATFGGYKVEVIYQDDLVNAFAAPGGFTYISTGLILQAESCGEIAGVMGHELGHVIERHGVEQIEDQFLASEIINFFLGDGVTADAAAVIYGFLSATQFSQADEEEADSVGLQVAYRAGYNPYGLVVFFQRLVELEQQQAVQVPEFLSSHPASEDRVVDVTAQIEEMYGDEVNPEGTQTYDCLGTTMTLAQIQAHITSGQVAVRPGTGEGEPEQPAP